MNGPTSDKRSSNEQTSDISDQPISAELELSSRGAPRVETFYYAIDRRKRETLDGEEKERRPRMKRKERERESRRELLTSFKRG